MTDELKETFFLECQELLESLEAGLMSIANGDADDRDETIGAVFRAVHSIKGGAGAFALDELVALAHQFETVLEKIRASELELNKATMKVLFTAADALADRVSADQSDTSLDLEREAGCIRELSQLAGPSSAPTPDSANESQPAPTGFAPLALDISAELDVPLPASEVADLAPEVGRAHWEIKIAASQGFYQRGGDATILLRALAALGDVDALCEAAGVPLIDELDPEQPIATWTVRLSTDAAEDLIDEVFEFALDDCDIEITSVGQSFVEKAQLAEPPVDKELSKESANVDVVRSAASEDAKPILTQTPAKTTSENDPVDRPSPASNRTPVETAPPKRAAADQAKAPNRDANLYRHTIRVELPRVEQLINLVGELVINQAMLAQRIADASVTNDAMINDGLDEFRRLTHDIQESVMAIRAQPVKPLFQRMSRIVREAAHATGKDVRLTTSGEWTEVDKTIVERLSEPLTHLIRNAVDHGLESGDDREAAGKPREGVVGLSAAHRSGRIVIEIADDGAGINREKIHDIAIERGVISPDAQLSPSEIDNLIFAPGFSTASAISDLSGRGVGMDVVKRTIQALGGRTNISSSPGHGSCFSISLPLTLAVLDGIVVSVSGQTVVLPLSSVTETIRAEAITVNRIGVDSHVAIIRGDALPTVDVAAALGFRAPLEDFTNCILVVVHGHESGPHALIVDDVHDQRQVVIKGLGNSFSETQGVSAATILGDGSIALILDVDSIIDFADEPPTKTLALAG